MFIMRLNRITLLLEKCELDGGGDEQGDGGAD